MFHKLLCSSQLRTRNPLGATKLFGAIVLLLSLVPTLASAAKPGDLASKWPVNDDDPSAHIPSVEERNSEPLEFGYFLQDLVSRAQPAFEAENWANAIKYYEALALAAPDAAVGFSRLCIAYAKTGRVEIAAANCARAVRLGGARVLDHLRLIDLTLRKQQLSQEDIAEVEASLTHLQEHAATHPQPLPGEKPELPTQAAPPTSPDEGLERLREKLRLKAEQNDALGKLAESEKRETSLMHLPSEIELRSCKLGAIVGDGQRLALCLAALRDYKFDERLLLPFSWAEALLHKDEAQASRLLNEAATLGLSPSALASMKAEHRKIFPLLGGLYEWWPLGVASVLGLLVFARLKAWRKKSRPTPAQRQEPTETQA